MAKRTAAATAVLDDVETIREVASSGTAVATGLKSDTHVLQTPGGVEIRVGEINMDAIRQTPGRNFDPQYANAFMAMKQRHEATGIQAATILNFLPIPLVVNSPMEELKVRIPPAPLPEEGKDAFSFHVWSEPAIVVKDMGENLRTPIDYMPVQLAKAFLDEYREFGGVVMFRGIPDAETLSRPDVREAIEAAKEAMVQWMLKKVEEANGQWNTPNNSGVRNIVTLHRWCAQRLYDLGIIDELPEWITPSKKLKDVAAKCPVCQTIPKPGAVECLACHYILDPVTAFLKNIINEEDASLERLTRKQVEDLGISAYVAETADEKPERLKRGDPKPLSLAALRAAEMAKEVEQASE